MPFWVHLSWCVSRHQIFSLFWWKEEKKAAVTYTGTANPQDLQLCVRSLSSLTEISAYEHVLTFIIFLQEILRFFYVESNWRNTVPKDTSTLGANSRVPVQTKLQEDAWHASGVQVSATPMMQLELQGTVLQELMEDLNHIATFPQLAIHFNHFLHGDMYKWTAINMYKKF